METWKFIIPIIVLILYAIGGWYIISIRRKEIRDKTFVYPKNGHHYIPLYRCKMKCPASGEWFDAIIYQECNTERLYVRERKDFLDKFVKLNDWENGNSNRQGVSEDYR